MSLPDHAATTMPDQASTPSTDHPLERFAHEEGSVATEYGLLAVVAATIVGVVLEWATSGGITGLLDRVLARVGSIIGI